MANANTNSSPSHEREDRKTLLSLSDGKPKHRRLSWRQEIFNRVVTPSRQPNTPTVPGRQVLINNTENGCFVFNPLESTVHLSCLKAVFQYMN